MRWVWQQDGPMVPEPWSMFMTFWGRFLCSVLQMRLVDFLRPLQSSRRASCLSTSVSHSSRSSRCVWQSSEVGFKSFKSFKSLLEIRIQCIFTLFYTTNTYFCSKMTTTKAKSLFPPIFSRLFLRNKLLKFCKYIRQGNINTKFHAKFAENFGNTSVGSGEGVVWWSEHPYPTHPRKDVDPFHIL